MIIFDYRKMPQDHNHPSIIQPLPLLAPLLQSTFILLPPLPFITLPNTVTLLPNITIPLPPLIPLASLPTLILILSPQLTTRLLHLLLSLIALPPQPHRQSMLFSLILTSSILLSIFLSIFLLSILVLINCHVIGVKHHHHLQQHLLNVLCLPGP